MAPKKKARKPAKPQMTIQEMARLGGLATAKKLTPEQRRKNARKAARARWAKRGPARLMDGGEAIGGEQIRKVKRKT
jgi:hypothetical protein